MTGYKVAPEALRTMASMLTDAGNQWQQAGTAINTGDALLGEYDLGLLGHWAGFVGGYNSARTEATKALAQGTNALHSAGTTLGVVASDYEHKDAEYYHKFGYMAEGM